MKSFHKFGCDFELRLEILLEINNCFLLYDRPFKTTIMLFVTFLSKIYQKCYQQVGRKDK